MDCSLPGFSVHGVSQARVLEWVAISFSRGSSRPRQGSNLHLLHLLHWHSLPLSHQGSPAVLLHCIKVLHCPVSFLILSLFHVLCFLPFSLPSYARSLPSFLYFRHSLTDMKSKNFCHGSSLFLCDAKYLNTWKHLVIWKILFSILGFPGGR